MTRERKRWPYVAMALIFVAGGLFTYLRAMPAYSQDEIRDLQARVDNLRALTATESCERTAFGDAEPIAEGMAILVDDPEVQSCLMRFQTTDLDDLLNTPKTPTHAWHWNLDRGEGSSAALPGHIHLTVSAPIPPEDEDAPEVVSECGWLAKLVERLAATDSSCSPLGPTHPDWLGDMMWAIGLGRAIAGISRWRARDGQRFRSFEEALRGIVVVRDLRRGPTSLLMAMISVAAEGVIVAQLQSFLIDDPELTDAQYARLDTTLAQILDNRIGAGTVMRTDRFAAVDSAAGSDELGSMLDYVATFEPTWCPDDALPTACIDTINRTPAVAPLGELGETLLGPRLVRNWQMKAAVRDAQTAFATYLARLAAADIALQQLRVLLMLARSRATSDECPPTIDAGHLVIPESDDPFELNHFSGDQYELVMPPLRVQPSFERTVMTFVCPAAAPAWLPRVDVVQDVVQDAVQDE